MTANRKSMRLAVVLIGFAMAIGVGALPATASSSAPTVQPPAGLCSLAPALVQPVCHVAGTAVSGVTGGLASGASAVVGGVADGVLGSISNAMANGAAWFVGKVADLVTASTRVDVTGGWFQQHYRQMSWIAATFALGFLLLTAAGSLLHRDPSRGLRGVGMVAAAGLGIGAAVTVTAALLSVTDALTQTVTRGSGHDLSDALSGASHALGVAGLGLPGTAPVMVTLLASAAAIVAGLLVWIELLLREAAIYAALLFFPLALAGLAWEPSRRWARRLAETLAALIFSKFVIAAVLSLAIGGLGNADGATAVLAGAGLLWVAALAPFLLMRIIGVLEVGVAAGHLEGVRSRGTHNAVYYGQTASYALNRRGGGGAMPLAVATAGAPYAAGWAAAGAARGIGGAAAGRAAAGPSAGPGPTA